MTIAARVAQVSSKIESGTRAGEFIQLAHALALADVADGGLIGAVQRLEANRGSPRVIEVLKAAVSAGTTTAWADLVTFQAMADGFLQTVARTSVLEAVRTNGDWRLLPPNARVGALTIGMTGSTVLEGLPKPVSRLTIADGGVLTPIKVAVLTVFTDELARFSGPIAQQVIGNELRTTLGTQIDIVLFNELLETGVASQASTGTTAANAWTDVKFLLNAVALGAASRPYFFG